MASPTAPNSTTSKESRLKIKTVHPGLSGAKTARDLSWLTDALTMLIGVAILALAGLLFWWLIPVATAGAVAVTFWQAVAIASVLRVAHALA